MSQGQRSNRAAATAGALAALALAMVSALALAPDARAQAPGPGAGPSFVPGEVIVRFKPSAPGARRDAIRDAADTQLEERLPLPGVQQLDTEPGTSVREATRALESRGAVAYAEPNFLRYPQATPDDEHYGELWGLERIDAPLAWDASTGDSEVTVAVVDSGVAYDHPDLVDNIWTNPAPATAAPSADACTPTDDVRGWDFVDCDNDPSDEQVGHGTHVAGTIGAAGDNDGLGVAGTNWDVSIMPLRVLGPDSGSVADIVSAFEYARDHGADIVNASFGIGGAEYRSELEEQAIRSAPDLLFVAAAGNDGTDNDERPFWPCSYDLPNLICVAATDESDAVASFSNTGRRSVDLGAPGTNIFSTRGRYSFEDFEGPFENTGWSTNGSWTTAESPDSDYDDVLVDSPGGNYANDAESWVQSRTINLAGRTDCRLDYQLEMDLENASSAASFDYLTVEASTDGETWQTLLGDAGGPGYQGPATADAPGDAVGPVYTGSHSGPVSNDLSAFEDTANFMVRFRLVTDGAETADGVRIDDVAADCRGWTPTGAEGYRAYAVMSGTSMAAPHVAGVAALALAFEPDASVLDLRAALLDGGDPLSALDATTVTGNRLNAAKALFMIHHYGRNGVPAPTSTITGDPPSRTPMPNVWFTFESDYRDVEFRCQVDDRPSTACESPFRATWLRDGYHSFEVSARRPGGAYGPVDQHNFLVDGTGPVMDFPDAVATMRRSGVTRVRLTCPASELSGPCRGQLKLKTEDRVRVSRRSTKRLTLGKASFSIPRGATERVRVAITRKGQTIVERESPLPVLGKAVARDALGNVGRGRGTFTLRSR